MLKPFYNTQPSDVIEIGVDEAGRGPMFGPVCAAAVILPKTDSFNFSCLKDSKRFHSKKKIKEVSEYIKQNAVDYHIEFCNELIIDTINIRNATHTAMHKAIRKVIASNNNSLSNYQLLIDGSDFKPYMVFNNNMLSQVKHTCITKGDNTYCAIAAASILAKTARDDYIEELCEANPELDERYHISSNKGYGTKDHLQGIHTYGITKFHRKSFGLCKTMNAV